MYKKLMFLISLVALIGLASIVSAADWTGLGATASFCDPDNWNPVGVPGPGSENEVLPAGPTPERGPIIDCVAVVGDIRGNPDTNMAIDWVVGGHLTVDQWEKRWGREPDGVCTFNMLGGTLTILDDDDSAFRIADHGHIVINVTDPFVLDHAGGWRMGDEDDAFIEWTMSGGTINLGNDFQIGDDGGAVMNFTGGTMNIDGGGGDMRLMGRGGEDVTVNYGGTTDMVCRELRVGREADDGATVQFNMTGGTIEARRVNTHEDGGGSHAEINLSGGSMVATEELRIHSSGTSAINISGTGVLECADIRLDNGVLDVNGNDPGCALIIDGDQVAKIGGYVGDGKLTGCGDPRGVVMDYGVTNPGKTTVTGDCDIDFCQAWAPVPADGAAEQVVDVLLKWSRGDGILTSRDRDSVYLGDDPVAVATDGPGDPTWKCYIRGTDPAEYDTSGDGLELWKTYYWRIDEIGSGDCPGTTVGNVWSFTTGCELIPGDLNLDCLVNFLDFAIEGNNWMDEKFFPDDG
jgi:hypothetical protein